MYRSMKFGTRASLQLENCFVVSINLDRLAKTKSILAFEKGNATKMLNTLAYVSSCIQDRLKSGRWLMVLGEVKIDSKKLFKIKTDFSILEFTSLCILILL